MTDDIEIDEEARKKIEETFEKKAEEILKNSRDVTPKFVNGTNILARTPWTKYPGDKYDEFRIELRGEEDDA